jgi:5-methylthioadenosine/S-adenosylhomocysteine deaminase
MGKLKRCGYDTYVALLKNGAPTIMNEHADTLFVHAHLFTMQGQGVGYIADGAVAVEGSRVVAVGPTVQLSDRFHADERINATGHAILPGLVDGHMHTPLAVVRGVAQDVSNWMQAALAPYSRYLSPESALAGTRLNVLEALRSGTTTMGDYTRSPTMAGPRSFVNAGVRAVLTPTINAMPPGGMAGWRVGDLYPLDESVGKHAIDEASALCRQLAWG